MKLELILLGREEVTEAEVGDLLEALPRPWRPGGLRHSNLSLSPLEDPRRGQVDAGRLLEAMAGPVAAEVVVGITARDLFLPVLAHVIGLSPLGARRAVVSLARLDPGPALGARRARIFQHRLLVEVVHEAGHALGLRHCPVPACVMHASLSPEELDLKASTYCPPCQEAVIAAGPPAAGGS